MSSPPGLFPPPPDDFETTSLGAGSCRIGAERRRAARRARVCFRESGQRASHEISVSIQGEGVINIVEEPSRADGTRSFSAVGVARS
jgi:hypothetical protein